MFHGYPAIVVNAQSGVSELGEMINNMGCLAVIWRYDYNSNGMVVSLRAGEQPGVKNISFCLWWELLLYMSYGIILFFFKRQKRKFKIGRA